MSRELLLCVFALLAGLFAAPLLIWAIGSRVLGPYTHGSDTHAGPLALLQDFFAGLAHGSIPYWVVALGPLGLILLGRLLWNLVRPRAAPWDAGAASRPDSRAGRRPGTR
ncbi:MAG TPA: hypothetical protein VIY54_09200 [Steroidobacteraceae bacterium]